jgi:hypothetical protein
LELAGRLFQDHGLAGVVPGGKFLYLYPTNLTYLTPIHFPQDLGTDTPASSVPGYRQLLGAERCMYPGFVMCIRMKVQLCFIWVYGEVPYSNGVGMAWLKKKNH